MIKHSAHVHAHSARACVRAQGGGLHGAHMRVEKEMGGTSWRHISAEADEILTILQFKEYHRSFLL
jgi:hypothetical protein